MEDDKVRPVGGVVVARVVAIEEDIEDIATWLGGRRGVCLCFGAGKEEDDDDGEGRRGSKEIGRDVDGDERMEGEEGEDRKAWVEEGKQNKEKKKKKKKERREEKKKDMTDRENLNK